MSGATPNKKKTSNEQLNFMVDFISAHKIMLHGKTKPSEANNNEIEKLWDELTQSLNAMGSGPHKSKIQWKKTFTDWKSNTKKKARECVRSEQRTGGGEPDGKKLTPIEEKLMAILSWIAVKGANVCEIGFEAENDELDGVEPLSQLTESNVEMEIDIKGHESEAIILSEEFTPTPAPSKLLAEESPYMQAEPVIKVKNKLQIAAQTSLKKSEPKPGPSKRAGEDSTYPQAKRVVKAKTNNLQKVVEVYAAGQKETSDILKNLKHLTEKGSLQFQEKNLELKEVELKLQMLKQKQRSQKINLWERELAVRERELAVRERELPVREREVALKEREIALKERETDLCCRQHKA